MLFSCGHSLKTRVSKGSVERLGVAACWAMNAKELSGTQLSVSISADITWSSNPGLGKPFTVVQFNYPILPLFVCAQVRVTTQKST